jgi:hypothetical protein
VDFFLISLSEETPVKDTKTFLAFSLLAGFALVFAACANPVFSFDDNEMEIDVNGHVTKLVVYTVYSSSTENTISYAPDGTYEEVERSWDSVSSAWSQSSGFKGTYSYAAATRIMTVNCNEEWNGGIGGSYQALTSANPSAVKTHAMPLVLGTHNLYAAATGSNGSYRRTVATSYWDDSSMEISMDITFAANMTSNTMLQTTLVYDSGHAVLGGMRSQCVYTVDNVFPSDITSFSKAKGKTITITSNTQSITPYAWTSGSDFTAGTAVPDHSADAITFCVSSDAKFILMPDNFSLARKLAF